MPALDRQYLLEVMAAEGEFYTLWKEATEDMEPGDDIFIAEIEYDLED